MTLLDKLWYNKNMEELILEVGMPLKKDLAYYQKALTKNGLYLNFACITHDLYYTKEKGLDGLSEIQMKNACVRIRKLSAIFGTSKIRTITDSEIKAKEKDLIAHGYHKIFDTIKYDYQYKKDGMFSYVQLQDIKDIGLLVYYNNPDYYTFDEDTQRELLFKELNSYGFDFSLNDLGLDKLRTLYYGKKMYSKNQNA